MSLFDKNMPNQAFTINENNRPYYQNNMYHAYGRCYNLTGSPICGNNVTDMSYTYFGCYRLTGSPVCGNNVTNMYCAYESCYNLTGSPVCGNNVTNMSCAYESCYDLYGNMFMQSDNVVMATNMLYGHSKLNTINIYVRPKTLTNTTLYKNKVGCGNWTLDTPNKRYYNAVNNIYVYYNWNGQMW